MWWPIVFWVLLVPTLIIGGFVYATTKKLYRLFELLSLFTYIIFIVYIIDVFSLSRHWILGLLFVSAILLMYLGYYISKHKPKPLNGKTLIVLLSALLLLIILGFLGSTFVTQEVTVPESYVEGEPVLTRTYTNEYFLPVMFPEERHILCYDKQEMWLEHKPTIIEVPARNTLEVKYSAPYAPRLLKEPGQEENQTEPTSIIVVVGDQADCLNPEQYEHYRIK